MAIPTTLPNRVIAQIRQSTLFLTNLQHFCMQNVSKENNNTIGFGIIGYGHIGRKHAQEILKNPQTELKIIADINPLQLPQNLPHVITTESVLELLSNQSINVVTIATPNGTHATLAIEALKSGKNVVIEKPMALTTQECERIIETSQITGKQVFCVMQNRFSPPSVWLKNLIENNQLGTIYQVMVQCWWNRDERYYIPNHWHGTLQHDGGILFTQFSHFVDLLYWLLGDINITHSRQHQFNHQTLTEFADAGDFNFEFGIDRVGKGSFIYSTSVFEKNFESSITLIGEKGTVKVGGQYMNEIVYCNIQDYQLPDLPPTNQPNNYGNYLGSASNHEYVVQEVVNTLKFNAPIQTTAVDGKNVVSIIEQVHNLAKKNN